MLPKLLLATNNAGKIREIRVLLSGIPYEIITPKEVGINIDVDESGTTYEANARLKAITLMQASGFTALGDDSGLEVEALQGEPGIRSARWAGEKATDADRIAYLLEKLKDVPPAKRQARFVCMVAIAEPNGKIHICEGECQGVITLSPQGSFGHGYDPVFFVPEYGKTMAELSMETKNRISHRGQAVRKAREVLTQIAPKRQTTNNF
ncbi:MAG: XTP/dITP diphosphatase [Dehalococcoidales bacterium]|nr:XTP/dITP diphosphatase [Dehalococcoidales bacterium]